MIVSTNSSIFIYLIVVYICITDASIYLAKGKHTKHRMHAWSPRRQRIKKLAHFVSNKYLQNRRPSRNQCMIEGGCEMGANWGRKGDANKAEEREIGCLLEPSRAGRLKSHWTELKLLIRRGREDIIKFKGRLTFRNKNRNKPTRAEGKY